MKTTILGKKSKEKPIFKSIKLYSMLQPAIRFERLTENTWGENVEDFEYATLICKGYCDVKDFNDLILMHMTENPSDNPDDTVLCQGNWNDGIWDSKDYLVKD